MNVALVFDRDFSTRLHQVAFHTPVWLVETPENRAAAEAEWMRAVEWPHIEVTLFRSDHDFRSLLTQVAIHHAVDGLDVIGMQLTPDVHEALTRDGFQRIETSGEGFRARKS